MSKLIVEMEMPELCFECLFRLDCELYINELMKPIKKRDFTAFKPLSNGCLIRGVLPDEHGDLIDKETAKNAFDSSFLTFRMKDGETMRGFYQRTIDELPVLIVTERKDDGKTAD